MKTNHENWWQDWTFNREAAKISVLSSGKTDKNECHAGEELIPSNRRKIIEIARFVYSPFGKALEKQTEKTGCCFKFPRPF